MSDLPRETIVLRIRSHPTHLPVVRAAVEKVCELVGFGADAAGHIVLSVDEALTNIIRHAYGNAPDQPIEVALAPTCDRGRVDGLEIRLRDHGRAVDPDMIRPRPLDEVRPGGLGVHIMTQCMDRIDYHAADGGGTQLTLVKKLRSAWKDCAP